MNSITSKQRSQYNRFTQDGARKALTIVDPDKDGLQRLFGRGDEWQDYLIAGIARFTAKMPDYGLALSILGADFITPEEVAKARKGVAYTDDQLSQFSDTVPSQEVLEWCRDNGYMLIAGPNRPMSLLEVRSLKKNYFFPKEGGWYTEQAFAQNDKAETRWIMLRKEPVPQSTSRNWNEQQALLSADEVTPNVAEVTWCVTTYKAVRNIYLLPSIYVRTSSLDSGDHRVRFGYFDASGLIVDDYLDDFAYDNLGGLAAKKF